MIKGNDIIGQHVVAIDSGQRIEGVHDLIFDHQANQVLGLLVDEGGWFRAAKVVPFEAIHSFGEDAIMIDSAAAVTSTRQDDRLADVLDSDIRLIGMTLLTTDGQDLGKIADVYFDEKTGHVEGYEATGGLFSDLSNGRTFVPAPENVQIGEHAAIVPLAVASAMQEQEPGGLRGAFHHAGDSLKDTYGNIADATKERQKEYVTGKTAGNDIILEDGTVLIRQGEVITAEQADQAEEHGRLTALATSVTGGAISGAYDNMAGASRERQKEYAIGKTAGSDITDDAHEVIVRKGEVITAEQADRAEAAGKLGTLASSATGGVLVATYGSARDRVQEGYDDIRGATAERQKAYVVGKTARTDVTTDAGETIVYEGGVITEFQANRAEQTGRLGALTAAAMGGQGQEQAAEHDRPEATIGRRARMAVRAPGGSVVAAQGQIVTPAILERAQHLGVEQQLMDATLTRRDTGSGTGTREALAGGLDSVSEGASNLWDRAKGWLGERREDVETANEERQRQHHEQRIKDALGRPVNRVILAPDDSIILNVGEIVTHKAVQLATDSEVLDVLLGSVSKEAPDLNPLNTRPDEQGRAALDSQTEPALQNRAVDPKSQG
ncbi:PRC-barrel domain-containing protein [Deinococcus aerophilus]|uniref:PRC-barrel domain-containing protein n=1 Tax=Deinococcus aerophilus TaxID=522488 RepID=A0ABQ2GNZ9_9DEIO|nr:PRC-barrel domain-containing protein [Deinococcus aerophilus]GGM04592.1 hypothetical protein GCM10010841_11240 [Deinococcus aerophilus]